MSKKYALIIGNTEYSDPGLAQLTAPSKDVEDFARVLRSKEICDFDDVKVFVNEPSNSVIAEIDEFFDQKKPDDLLVLYFSGHGIKDEIGSLYLGFKNTNRSRLRSSAIKSDYIREAMDQSRSKRQVLILDCCNSGAFPQGTKAELGGAMGLLQAFQGYGRFVLTASDATQFAWEGNKVIGGTDNSLFTHYLIEGLKGEADNDGDGKITVDELYDYAYQQISKVTPKQRPTKSASKQEGEIVLRQNMRIEDIKPVNLPDDLLEEIEDDRPYVREAAVQKLDKILKGRNLGQARSAAVALEKIVNDENTTRRVSQVATQVLDSYKQELQKADEERLAKLDEEAIETSKLEVEKLTGEKHIAGEAEVEAKRLADENAEAEKVVAQKVEEERIAKAKLETKRPAKEKQTAGKKAGSGKKKEIEQGKVQNASTPINHTPSTSSPKLPYSAVSRNNTVQKPSRQSYWIMGAVGAIIIVFFLFFRQPPSEVTGTLTPDIPSSATESPIVAPTLTQTIETPEIVEPPEVIEVTFWHAYGTGSAEETVLAAILEQAAVDLPQYQINVLQVPFNDIFNKYDTDVAAGGGPDMFIAPNDNLGGQARAGTIADITDLVAGKLGDYSELSQGGMMYDGKMYGLPESLKAVALWYNTDLLPEAPSTTDELQALMEGGTPVAISFGCYHHWGFFGSFGGQIFDDEFNLVADEANQANVASAVSYLNDLYQISRANGWPRNDSDGLAPFTEGSVAAITNGNWAMGDYRNALGDKLAVAPIPAGPGGSSNPLLGVDGFYFNPNSENTEAAIEVSLYLSNKHSQEMMMNEAGHVPANTTVTVSDPLIQSLLDAFSTAYFRPQVEAMGNYWGNFCGTDQVFDAGTPAAGWVATAFESATK